MAGATTGSTGEAQPSAASTGWQAAKSAFGMAGSGKPRDSVVRAIIHTSGHVSDGAIGAIIRADGGIHGGMDGGGHIGCTLGRCDDGAGFLAHTACPLCYWGPGLEELRSQEGSALRHLGLWFGSATTLTAREDPRSGGPTVGTRGRRSSPSTMTWRRGGWGSIHMEVGITVRALTTMLSSLQDAIAPVCQV